MAVAARPDLQTAAGDGRVWSGYDERSMSETSVVRYYFEVGVDVERHDTASARVENVSNPESLKIRKLYRVLADADAAPHGYLRVVDESGESYLYPGRYFVPVTLARPLPRAARKAFP
jgi:hypothetical protein